MIERSRGVDLPRNGRNAADLALLIPGAEAIAVNCARPCRIGNNLDGVNNEDLMNNLTLDIIVANPLWLGRICSHLVDDALHKNHVGMDSACN